MCTAEPQRVYLNLKEDLPIILLALKNWFMYVCILLYSIYTKYLIPLSAFGIGLFGAGRLT